jgi:pimeloyl-ACP methyl ester carboxylesterase
MAIGMRDPVLGPPVMEALSDSIANCPQPIEIAEAGHFVQEWGGDVAKKALEAFRLF